eukprot:5912086-Prymnesium_polylepis.1
MECGSLSQSPCRRGTCCYHSRKRWSTLVLSASGWLVRCAAVSIACEERSGAVCALLFGAIRSEDTAHAHRDTGKRRCTCIRRID